MFYVCWVKATVYYDRYSLKNLLNLCRKGRKDTRTNQFLQPPEGILRVEERLCHVSPRRLSEGREGLGQGDGRDEYMKRSHLRGVGSKWIT